MNIAIVGAGIAGLACADELVKSGHRVSLFDKGRGAGGRMATRRIDTPLGEAAFDHGAQYFTVRDQGFECLIRKLEADGHAARWPIAGEDAWVGAPGMNAIVKAMASRHDVTFSCRVKGLDSRKDGLVLRCADKVTKGPFDAIVIAIPAEQAAALLSLHDFELACSALRARSQPCWTGMFAFAERLDAPDQPVRDKGEIAWAVRNSAKPGRSGPESWVVQARPPWSDGHIEDSPEEINAALLSELGKALGCRLPDPLVASAHRWRFAMSSATGDGAMWSADTRLGVCGDWLLGPRVECAWLSGRMMAERIMADVPAPA